MNNPKEMGGLYIVMISDCVIKVSNDYPSCSMLVMPDEMVADCVTHIGVPPAS